MTANDLETQGARAAAAMSLTQLSENNLSWALLQTEYMVVKYDTIGHPAQQLQ